MATGGVNTRQGTSVDFNEGTAWTLGTAPVTGEILVFPKLGSAVTLSTNMDQSAKDFAAVITQPGCNVQIGTSGNPLLCACSGTVGPGIIRHEGDKAFYLKADHATLDILQVECNSPNKTLAMQIDDDATAQILKVRLLKGRMVVASNITAMPYMEVGHKDNPDGDAVLLVEAHATNVLTRLVMANGMATVSREITDAIIAGGRLVFDGAEPLTNLYVSGGTVEYDSTGTLVLGMVLRGMLDFTKTWKIKTVTTLRGIVPGRIRLHDGVQVENSEYVTGVATFESAGSDGSFA